MDSHSGLALVLLAPLLLAGAAAPAMGMAPGPARRLFLLEATATAAEGDGLLRLRAAISKAVTGAGLVLVESSPSTSTFRGCQPPACLADLATASGVTHVVWMDARFARQQFQISLQMWDSRSGERLGIHNRRCRLCTLVEFASAGEGAMQALLASALAPATAGAHGESSARPRPGLTTGTRDFRPEPPRSPDLSFPSASLPAAARSDTPSRPAFWSGMVAAALGLGALSTGTYLWRVDGTCPGAAPYPCPNVRDTGQIGKRLMVAGGLSGVIAIGLVLWSYSGDSVRVSLLPAGISLGGRI
jgi:hypothetical protein